MNTKKNPIMAFLLALIIPGTGQIYNGQKHKTILGYSLFFVIPILFIVFKLTYFFSGLVTFLAILLGIYLWNIGDALLNSLRSQREKTARIPVWLAMVPVILLSTNVYGIMRHLNPQNNILGIRANYLLTNSMAPTAKAGDFFMLATKYHRPDGLQKGEIVTFIHPGLGKLLFKRLIAVAGDTVAGLDTAVFVNDKKLDEPYAQFIGQKRTDNFNVRPTTNDFGPIVVPEGKLFVLGDNRDNSFDSRDPKFGFIDIEDVLQNYKPLYIYWSPDKSRIGKRIE